jgi:hypothetical protein
MRILSVEEAAKLLSVPDIESFFDLADWQYPDSVSSYFLPKDSGEKVALSRIIANNFLQRGAAVLWVRETGIWRSAEHMDLFFRYRLSYGEVRSLSHAPIHIFESYEDADAFISIFFLGLSFVWGIELASLDRSVAMTIGHDEWLDYRFALGQEAFVYDFRKLIEPSLRSGSRGS